MSVKIVKDILEKLRFTMTIASLREVSRMEESEITFLNRDQKIGAAYLLGRVLRRLEGEGRGIEEAIGEVESWLGRAKGLPQISAEDLERAHYILKEAGIINGPDRIQRRAVIFTIETVLEILKRKK